MQKNFKIDSINELLEACILAYPVSSFVISLYKQYRERGSLSKKQLQGLHAKAMKVPEMPPGKLAAVEAIINKMPTRDKYDPPVPKPLYEKDEKSGTLIKAILEKFPEHKRVLFLQAKYENNEPLSTTDLNDLQRIAQLLKK